MKKRFILILIMSILTMNVYASESLSINSFISKMKDKNYIVEEANNSVVATKKDYDADNFDMILLYTKYDSVEEAKNSLKDTCDRMNNNDIYDISSVNKVNCDKNTKKENGFIKISYRLNDDITDVEYYMISYRIKDSVIIGTGSIENKNEINDVMKYLGYYSDNNLISIIITIIVVVLLIIVIGIVIIVMIQKKKKNKFNINDNNNDNISHSDVTLKSMVNQ